MTNVAEKASQGTFAVVGRQDAPTAEAQSHGSHTGSHTRSHTGSHTPHARPTGAPGVRLSGTHVRSSGSVRVRPTGTAKFAPPILQLVSRILRSTSPKMLKRLLRMARPSQGVSHEPKFRYLSGAKELFLLGIYTDDFRLRRFVVCIASWQR